MNKFGVYLTDKRAKMPMVAYSGTSACFDLNAIEDTTIKAKSSALIPVGLRITIPQGYYLEFATRSGMGIKRNLRVHPGIIDSGYTGEISVKVYNDGDVDQVIEQGKGCVQVKVHKIPEYKLELIGENEWSDYLTQSQRGVNGFGSSDKEK